jgi:flavin reductase ActVB
MELVRAIRRKKTVQAPRTNERSTFDIVFRRACSFLPTGVVVVAGVDARQALFGFTASSFCAVSWRPALVSLSVARESTSLTAVRDCSSFGVSVLSEEDQ